MLFCFQEQTIRNMKYTANVSTKNAGFCTLKFCEVHKRNQGQSQECSVWLDHGTCRSLELSWEKWSQDINKRSSFPKNATGLPTNVLVPKRSKRGEFLGCGKRYPIILIIQSFSLYAYDMRHIQSKLLNLPSNLLTEPCKYCMRMHMHSASQSFCISWNFSSSKSCGFSTASSSQTALDFKGSAPAANAVLLKSKSNKVRQPSSISTKKHILKRSFLSYIQKFLLGSCHHSFLPQIYSCSWRTKGPAVWCKGCSCGFTMRQDNSQQPLGSSELDSLRAVTQE